MQVAQYGKTRTAESFGVRITANHLGFSVQTDGRASRLLFAEIWRAGKLLKRQAFDAMHGWRESDEKIDPAECGVRVLDTTDAVIVILDYKGPDPFPFMTRDGPQHHITESYVSVPPALHITDPAGDVWTLGMTTAPKHRSPDGEFAFAVLKNGVDMQEIASRIEIRAGKVKIFTTEGWKAWTGQSFF